MRPIALIGAILVLGFVASKCEFPVPKVDQVNPNNASVEKTDVHKTNTWTYGNWEDKFTGASGSYASLLSENTVNLEFPYQGDQHASLGIDQSDNIDIAVKQGQVTCDRSCYILIGFDENKAESFLFYPSGDKSIAIYSFDKKLKKKIYSAKKMTVRIHFYRNDFFDFQFEVAGLKPIVKTKK